MQEVRLTLTPAQFQVIYEFLYNLKLGNRNQFETEISDLMIEFEDLGAHDIVEHFEEVSGTVPHIIVHFDQYGPEFEVQEMVRR